MAIDPSLTSLYERAIAHYRGNEGKDWLVAGSIPILYFGNLRRYRASAIKVVTAGLNPSYREFCEERFEREVTAELRPETLERTLSRYFEVNPYKTWFDRAFETLLQHLGTSFYGQSYPGRAPSWWRPKLNWALHTDLCSPLATNTTWSDLSKETKADLLKWGRPLWMDLIKVLAPDVIVISVAASHLENLGNLPWRSFSPFPAATRQQEMKIAPFAASHILWGQASRHPLMYLKNEQRAAVAQTILAQPEFALLRNRLLPRKQ
jgi:hypothetical protein